MRFANRELITSMDCFLLWRPWKNNQPWKPKTEGLHIDQNPFHKYKTKIWCSILSWDTSCEYNLLPGWVFNASREWYHYYLWITRFSFKNIFYSFLADLLLQISASFLAIFSQDFHSGRRSWGGSQVAHWLCTRHCQVIGVKVILKILEWKLFLQCIELSKGRIILIWKSLEISAQSKENISQRLR